MTAVTRAACRTGRRGRAARSRSCDGARSPCSTPASAGSPSCTSCSCTLPARGLRLPRRHRALPLRRAQPARARGVRARDRRGAARAAAKLLVVACNSATAAALPALRDAHDETTLGVDVLGVVSPEAVQAVAATRNGRIGAAGHAGDGRERRLRARGRAPPTRTSTLDAVACPDLAPIIQGGFPFDRARGRHRPRATARRCARPGVDTVILGCTHYPLVRPMLQRTLGRGVEIVTSGARAGAPGRARARRARRSTARRERRGRLPLPVHRRRRGVPRARHALPADAARRRSQHVELAPRGAAA